MKARPITYADVVRITTAIRYMKDARDSLRKAGAVRAASYAGRALKSAEGAYRNARRAAPDWKCGTCGAAPGIPCDPRVHGTKSAEQR